MESSKIITERPDESNNSPLVKKRSVYLFQPNFKIGEGKFTNYWLPYSAACVWAYASSFQDIRDCYELKGLFFQRENIKSLLDKIREPSVIGFSCYVWNWKYTLYVAKELKQQYPTALIIFGGPQVPENSKRFFEEHPFVDIACIAEGEQTFTDVLRSAKDLQPDFSNVTGCLLKGNSGETVTTPTRERMDLERIPSPYLSGVLDNLVKDNPRIRWNTTIETTRGCPFACTFCDWGSLIFSKVKKIPETQVMGELDWISNNKIDYVFAADPNFGIYPKRDKRIIDRLIEGKNRTGFPKTINIQWYKNSNETVVDLAKPLTDSNLNRALTLSIQSLDPKVLTAIKRKNIAFSKLGELLELCQKKGIPTYTELILGLPEETKDSWESGLSELLELGQHNTIEVWLCELIQNAELNNNASKQLYGIETRVVQNHFEQSKDESLEIPEEIEIVHSTKTMSHEDLIQSYLYTWIIINIHVYGWSQIYSRFLKKYLDLDFASFYKHLQLYIEENPDTLLHSEYRSCEKLIRDYFIGKFDNRFCKYSGIMLNGKTALWKSQFIFHHHHQQVSQELKLFFDQYAIEKTLKADTEYFQQNFVTNMEYTYPFDTSYNYDILEYVTQKDAELTSGEFRYRYDLREEYRDKEDYTIMLYFRRRQGWGKANISDMIALDSTKHVNDPSQETISSSPLEQLQK